MDVWSRTRGTSTLEGILQVQSPGAGHGRNLEREANSTIIGPAFTGGGLEPGRPGATP
jgi:hypothetical protein